MAKFAKSIMLATLTAAVVGMSVLTSTTASQAEPLGSTCSDCANYRGEYSIENHTGVTLAYEFRWGDDQPWRQVILPNDTIHTHTYRLGDDPRAAVPTPSVRLVSNKVPHLLVMDFYAVRVDPGFTSPGTVIKRGSPKPYMFWISPRDFGVHLLPM